MNAELGTRNAEPLPPLRWLVRVRASSYWDRKIEEVRESIYREKPVLQYRDGETWHDVPTVEEPAENKAAATCEDRGHHHDGEKCPEFTAATP